MTALRLALAASTLVLLAGCTSSGRGQTTDKTSSPVPAPSTSATSAGPRYFVSVGDSYAAGYQPSGNGKGATTRNGFAYQLVTQEAARGDELQLVNFGCSGATTASALHSRGCAAADLGPGAASYSPSTQATAAESFLRAHRNHIGLITVVLGGNDLLPCGLSGSALTCVTSAMSTVTSNLTTLLTGLRGAAGPNVKIVGLTYPNVLLAGLLSSDPEVRALAAASVQAFQVLVNPRLKATYETVGADFVDVTAATGGYGPLSAKTTLAPYGTIPVAVAKVCTLTYSCQYTDIHPRTAGYATIAQLVAAELR